MGKPDRDFMIAIRQNWDAAALGAETPRTDELLEHIPPIDVYLNAIHRIVQLQIVPDVEFLLQSTFSNLNKQDSMTVDGDQPIVTMFQSLSSEGFMHYMIPNNIDIMAFYFNANSSLGEVMFTSDFYKNFFLSAASNGRLFTKPEETSGEVTVGEVDLITIMEFRVA